MEVQGILSKKYDERSGVSQSTGAAWKIASYLIVVPGMYDKKISVDVHDGMSGRIRTFDSLLGQEVICTFDINAREYQGKWYNSLQAFAIRKVVRETVAPVSTSPSPTQAATGALPPLEAPANTDDPPF